MKPIILFLIPCFPVLLVGCTSQLTTPSESAQKQRTPELQALYDTLKAKDSLMFELGFNGCDSMPFVRMVDEDFEFYHDQGGITENKAKFMESAKSLCNMSYKPIRKLVPNSLNVFPLHNNGTLYGAMQMGEHQFYALEDGKPEYLTSTAKFTHVWLLKDGSWKLSRVLSYDHQSPNPQ